MSYYTPEETYKFTHRIYKTLREYPSEILWKKIRGNWGEYDKETEEMFIDFRGALVPTIIHECIHHWHKDWCETKVTEEERRIVSSLTPHQAFNIIKTFINVFDPDN